MHSNFNDLKTRTMTAKKYLLDIGFDDAHLPGLFNNDDKSYYQISTLMEEYHQHKLKFLGLHIVMQHREQLLAFAEFLYEGHDKEVEARIVDDYLNSK